MLPCIPINKYSNLTVIHTINPQVPTSFLGSTQTYLNLIYFRIWKMKLLLTIFFIFSVWRFFGQWFVTNLIIVSETYRMSHKNLPLSSFLSCCAWDIKYFDLSNHFCNLTLQSKVIKIQENWKIWNKTRSIKSKFCFATLYFFGPKVLRIIFYPLKNTHSNFRNSKMRLKVIFFWDTL